MTPIRNYLEKEKLPEDPVDARTLMEKIKNYTMEDEVLYRKSYLVPLMRCVGPLQANYIIRKVHMGSCGMHDWPRQVVAKAINLGYYWPSMHRDVERIFKKRTKRKQKTTKLSTGWKRQSQSEAKVSQSQKSTK
ncbi:hypothetical protein Tco_0050681 [Tanacetum coccineum]